MFKHNKRGFTLIEILVAIAIVGILAGVLLVNFRGDEKGRELNTASLTVLDGLKQTQTKALSGDRVSGEVPIRYGFVVSDTFDFSGDAGHDCSTGCMFAEISTGLIHIANFELGDHTGVVGSDVAATVVSFDLPRANPDITIGGASVSTALFEVEYQGDVSVEHKCVEVNSISGRMDILPGVCGDGVGGGGEETCDPVCSPCYSCVGSNCVWTGGVGCVDNCAGACGACDDCVEISPGDWSCLPDPVCCDPECDPTCEECQESACVETGPEELCATTCGDGVCDPGDTPDNCLNDCPPCDYYDCPNCQICSDLGGGAYSCDPDLSNPDCDPCDPDPCTDLCNACFDLGGGAYSCELDTECNPCVEDPCPDPDCEDCTDNGDGTRSCDIKPECIDPCSDCDLNCNDCIGGACVDNGTCGGECGDPCDDPTCPGWSCDCDDSCGP